MADVLDLAQDLYDEACIDGTLLAEYQQEKSAILKAIRSGQTTGDIISGTKNGASYTMRAGYTLEDRKKALSYAIQGILSRARPSNISRGYFL
jgi:hypothetical protein